jgi:glycine betaine/proline transport system permease protein
MTDRIKNWTLFYLLLPFKFGLAKSVRPDIWGFTLTPWIRFAYVGFTGGIALLIGYFWSWRGSVIIVIASGFYYFGTTGIPWTVFILGTTLVAFRIGGRREGLFTLFGLSFILVSGSWYRAMLSLELTGVAVFVSFLIGSSLGIWAARSDRLSTFLRPINDTLQTMPSFVFLIPKLMVFMVGEFSALIAFISYAIVPAIRYTEHGIRNVPSEIVEAATMLGCTNRQLLWQVQLPLAIPEIMIGLNQTIMMALAMLVIAALIGTLGLEQMVYMALSEADFGKGAIAGLGIAFIAMIGDRIIQSWSLRKMAELDLA